MTTLAFFNDQFIPLEQACIPLTCTTLHYGTGCFGGLRAYWNERHGQLYGFRFAEHYHRLLDSARLLMCNLTYSADDLVDITLELLARQGCRQNCYVRPLVYKDNGIFKYQLHDGNDKIAIFTQTLDKLIAADSGANVCTSSWRRVDDTALPARGKINGSYVNSALIKSEALLNGFDEAIVLNRDGHVSEASAANLMIVRDGVLITPPVHANVLEGITRRTFIELAQAELGLEVVERNIDRTELYLADEAFFCGTAVQLAAIRAIDHRLIGNGQMGPVACALRSLYLRLVMGEIEKYAHWLTPVPVLAYA